MPELHLFFKSTCPFCQKVLKFMDENDIHLPLKDILADPSIREELVTKGGSQQVPALEIDGEIMYESDDIIEYLKKNS